MARLPRVIAVGVLHHVTQRGNARQFILASDDERRVYLDLFQQYTELHQLSVLGYCLMSNHVHLIVIPPGRSCTGYGAEADARAVRSFLERPPPIVGARVAGAILLLPTGCASSVGCYQPHIYCLKPALGPGLWVTSTATPESAADLR